MSWTRKLRIKHLKLLIELSESGSLSDTARITHTTQPGLSKWLKELEEDIGAPLFDRHARGLRPTVIGDLLIQYAHRMLSESDRAQENIASIIQGGARIIYVGTSPATAPSFVPAALLTFLEKYPNVTLSIQEGTMNEMLERLELGKLDLVVGRMDNYRPRDPLVSTILYSEKLAVVARPDHPLVGRKGLKWSDLYLYEWIIWPKDTPIRSKLDHALTADGLKPAPLRIESSSQVANIWLIKNSDMISISSERVATHFADSGLIAPLDITLENSGGAVGMCWRDTSENDPVLNVLLDCFRDEAEVVKNNQA